MRKKEITKRLTDLERRVEMGVTDQNLCARLEVVEKELNCIADSGHHFVFTGTDYTSPFGYFRQVYVGNHCANVGHKIYVFTCKCDRIQIKNEYELTQPEQMALKKLNVL